MIKLARDRERDREKDSAIERQRDLEGGRDRAIENAIEIYIFLKMNRENKQESGDDGFMYLIFHPISMLDPYIILFFSLQHDLHYFHIFFNDSF